MTPNAAQPLVPSPHETVQIGVGMPSAFYPPEDVAKLREEVALYHSLLLLVGNKYPGETRHETAARYIRQAEEGRSNDDDFPEDYEV